jgi:small subunit ribosomal protein S28e
MIRKPQPQKGKGKKQDKRENREPIPAIVEEIVGRTGTRGEVTQVRCKLLSGVEKDKVMRRNVKGAIRIGDVIILRETEIEARKLNQTSRVS